MNLAAHQNKNENLTWFRARNWGEEADLLLY